MKPQSSAPTWRNVVVLTVLLLFCQRTTTNGVLEENLVASEPLVPSSRTHYNETESDTVLTIGVNPALRRKRRDIFHLYNMMTCTTGCDPLKYKGYGCYCGFLGSGVIMDGIDRCCKIHDYCYGAAECHQSLIYFVPYRWKCSRGHPYCVTGYGQSKGPNDLCAHQLCECDRQFAECISQYPCPEKKAKCASNPLRSLG